VTDFQNWLRDRYGTPAALSGAWRQVIASFDDAAPPGNFVASHKEDLPPFLDWCEFRRARGDADARGDAISYLWPPAPTAEMPPRMVYERVRLAARELGPYGRPPTVAQAVDRVVPAADAPTRELAARAAIMHGAGTEELPKGVPVDLLAPWLRMLSAQPWEPDRKMLLLYPRVYIHLRQLCGVTLAYDADHPPTWSADDPTFGFDRPIQIEGPALFGKFVDLTARTRFSFAVCDSRIAPEAVRGRQLVICPTLELLEAEAMRTLDAYVAGGGFLALGPRIPLVDETMQPNDTLARYFGTGLSGFATEVVHCGDGAMLTLPGYSSPVTIEQLAFESGIAKALIADGFGIDSAVHRAGRERLFFVANPNDFEIKTRPVGEAFRSLTNVETGAAWPDGGKAELAVPPRSVTAWQVV
jgi:hypothetical protein